MCSPARPVATLPLGHLSLDQLGILVTHPRVNGAIRGAFATALHHWVTLRLQRLLGRSTQLADREDLAHEFIVDCWTHHLPAWSPGLCSMSAYLFLRLRSDVVDFLRKTTRRKGRFVDVDDTDLTSPDTSFDAALQQRAAGRRERLVEAAVLTLPRRRRMVMRRTLNGETLQDIARDGRLSTSTLSREKTMGIVALQRLLATGPHEEAAAA